MWWRFIVFCFLVSFILFIVLNYLHDRPVVHLFFKRCCDDGIENDDVIFETFKDNYLKERLIALEIVADNGTFVPEDANIEEMMELLREKINVHDPHSRRTIELFEEEYIASDKNVIKKEGVLEVFETETKMNEVTENNDLKSIHTKDFNNSDEDVTEILKDYATETSLSDLKNETSNEINAQA